VKDRKPWRFLCPEGHWLLLPAEYLNKYGLPHDGIACPKHQLRAGRDGRLDSYGRVVHEVGPEVRGG
jgi:hypothetical protein